MRKSAMINGIKKASWSLISVRFNGVPVFVKVKKLSDLEIQAIGNFSLIGGGAPVTDWRKIIATAEIQNELVKASLVTPSHADIFNIVGIPSFIEEKKKQFIEIEKQICELPKGPLKKELETAAALLRMQFELILPNDFCTDISDYILGRNRTNIDKITNDILLECYFSHKQFGGRPSMYCDDETLTPFNKRDIDNNALRVGLEWEKGRKAQ